MQCPVCRVELKMAERQSVEIDYCSQCRGVWLDRGELDKIIERSAATSFCGDRGDGRHDAMGTHTDGPRTEGSTTATTGRSGSAARFSKISSTSNGF